MDVRVTIKKHEGDDVYSWAVFINGVVVAGLTGLNRSQAGYYRLQILDDRPSARKAARKRIAGDD